MEEEQNRSGAVIPDADGAINPLARVRATTYGEEMLRLMTARRNARGPPTKDDHRYLTYVSLLDLLLNLYHDQWKFRDEVRPRFAPARSRT